MMNAAVKHPLQVGAPTLKDHPDLGIKYDPAAAKKELQSYLDEKKTTADKLDLTLMFNTSAGHQKIAEAIQQMWKDNLGLDVKVVNQEWKVYLVTTKDPKATPGRKDSEAIRARPGLQARQVPMAQMVLRDLPV